MGCLKKKKVMNEIWCLRGHCWNLRLWPGVTMGSLTSQQPCSPLPNKLHMYPDTILPEDAFASLTVWATVACLLDEITWAKLWSSCASLRHHCLWPDAIASSPTSLPWTLFDRHWPLQTGKTPHLLQFCWEVLSPPACNTSALRPKCAFVAW